MREGLIYSSTTLETRNSSGPLADSKPPFSSLLQAGLGIAIVDLAGSLCCYSLLSSFSARLKPALPRPHGGVHLELLFGCLSLSFISQNNFARL